MIQLLVLLVVVGLLVWLVESLPIPEPFRTVIRVVFVLIVVLWLLQFLGVVTVPLRLNG